jgi:hypothetical protein
VLEVISTKLFYYLAFRHPFEGKFPVFTAGGSRQPTASNPKHNKNAAKAQQKRTTEIIDRALLKIHCLRCFSPINRVINRASDHQLGARSGSNQL